MGIEGNDQESVKARKQLAVAFFTIVAIAMGSFAYLVVNSAMEQKDKENSCHRLGGILINRVCHKKDSILYVEN